MVPANLSLTTLRGVLLLLDKNNPRRKMRVLYRATLPAALKDRHTKVRPSDEPIELKDLSVSNAKMTVLRDHPDSPELVRFTAVCSRESWKAEVEDIRSDIVDIFGTSSTKNRVRTIYGHYTLNQYTRGS